MSIMRRMRGALGIASAWAIAWGFAGAALSRPLRVLANALPPTSFFDRLFDAAWVGWYGLLTGFVFAGVLALAARRRTFRELTAGRMAAWGAAAGVLFATPPMAYMLARRPDGWRTDDAAYLGGILVLSIACAVGSLWLARFGSTAGKDAEEPGTPPKLAAGVTEWSVPMRGPRAAATPERGQ